MTKLYEDEFKEFTRRKQPSFADICKELEVDPHSLKKTEEEFIRMIKKFSPLFTEAERAMFKVGVNLLTLNDRFSDDPIKKEIIFRYLSALVGVTSIHMREILRIFEDSEDKPEEKFDSGSQMIH